MNQAYEAQIVRAIDSFSQSHRNLSIAVSQLVTVANRLLALQEKNGTERQPPAVIGGIEPRLELQVPEFTGIGGRTARPPRNASPKRKGGRR